MLGRLLPGLSWVNFLSVLVRCSRSLFQNRRLYNDSLAVLFFPVFKVCCFSLREI